VNPKPLPAPLAALALALPCAALSQVAHPCDPLAVPGRVGSGCLVDLVGPRILALGGGTGLVSGNDGIFVNPGAIAARKRYAIDGIYSIDRRGAVNAGAYLGASVVDALSTPVAVSFSYVRPLEGAEAGNAFSLGLAGELMDRLHLGVQGRYQKLSVKAADGSVVERLDVVTADAGLLWEVSDYVTIGAAGSNVVPTGHEEVLPRSIGAGFSLGSDTSLKLVGDWRADLDRVKDAAGKGKTTNRFSGGVEAFLGNLVTLRAGYLRDETASTSWWCAGAGLVTQGGVALDVGYRQSFDDQRARVIAIGLKAQFLNM
jgi:hypothetical protein